MSNQAEFAIQKLYLKDLSFESPVSPAVFLKEWNPEVDVEFNVNHAEVDAEHQEVVLTVTITARFQKETMFIVEVKQAGIFTMKNIPEQDREPILKGVCPNILFPYARQQISTVVTDGGFPPLYVAPVNFEAIYLQQQTAAKNEN